MSWSAGISETVLNLYIFIVHFFAGVIFCGLVRAENFDQVMRFFFKNTFFYYENIILSICIKILTLRIYIPKSFEKVHPKIAKRIITPCSGSIDSNAYLKNLEGSIFGRVKLSPFLCFFLFWKSTWKLRNRPLIKNFFD